MRDHLIFFCFSIVRCAIQFAVRARDDIEILTPLLICCMNVRAIVMGSKACGGGHDFITFD